MGYSMETKNDRTDAITRDDTWRAAITVNDGGAGRTAVARSRTDSARLTGRPVSCRSPSTARLLPVGGIAAAAVAVGARRSGSAISFTHSLYRSSLTQAVTLTRRSHSVALCRSTVAVVPQHARARATVRRRRKDGFFKVFPTPRACDYSFGAFRFVRFNNISLLLISIYYIKYARVVPRVSL